jgi:hypothetical protein
VAEQEALMRGVDPWSPECQPSRRANGETGLPLSEGPMRRHMSRLALAASLGAALAFSASIVNAAHTLGTLDCGSAGVFQVDGVKPAGPPFDVPGPWSGIFLLEDTTQVFRAFSNSHFGIDMVPASTSPRPLITCTLTSEGPMFDPEWTLVGMLLPGS